MNIGKTLFAQLMDFLPWSTFARIAARYGGDARVRTLCCAEQYRAMAFAQLTYRESLRDIEVCLSARATAKLWFFDVSSGLEQVSQGRGDHVDHGREGCDVAISASTGPGGLEQAVEPFETGIAV